MAIMGNLKIISLTYGNYGLEDHQEAIKQTIKSKHPKFGHPNRCPPVNKHTSNYGTSPSLTGSYQVFPRAMAAIANIFPIVNYIQLPLTSLTIDYPQLLLTIDSPSIVHITIILIYIYIYINILSLHILYIYAYCQYIYIYIYYHILPNISIHTYILLTAIIPASSVLEFTPSISVSASRVTKSTSRRHRTWDPTGAVKGRQELARHRAMAHQITYIHTYNTIQYNTLHYTTIQYNTILYITLHYITLHYITYIHTYIYIYIYDTRLYSIFLGIYSILQSYTHNSFNSM